MDSIRLWSTDTSESRARVPIAWMTLESHALQADASHWSYLVLACGISIAVLPSRWQPIRGSGQISAASAGVLDPEIREEARKMLALRERSSDATNFLKCRLLALPNVRQAHLEHLEDEIDLWVLVDGPRMRAQRQVVHEACESMARFPGLWIKCHVIPASEAPEIHKSGNAVELVSR